VAVGGAEPGRGADLTGRARFEEALAGRGVAWAPLLWERLAELVRQPAPEWWRDATVAQRLLVDAAGVAGADALFVVARASGNGLAALDSVADGDDVRAGCELVGRLRESAPFAVIAALPGPERLLRDFEVDDLDAAEDALADLARAFLEAGADALAVIGADARAGARRVSAVGTFFGRPVLAIAPGAAWFEAGSDASVATVSPAGAWPALAAGLVVTGDDVSALWDADRLHAVGAARP
jgi:hypothetical protein